MEEMEKEEEYFEKKAKVLEFPKKIMLNFLKNHVHVTEEELKSFEKAIETAPIDFSDTQLEYLKCAGYYGVTRTGSRQVLIKSEPSTNIADIATIIHEIAHYLDDEYSNNEELSFYGEKDCLFIVEGMATIFSEVCINEWLQDGNKIDGCDSNEAYADYAYAEEKEVLYAILYGRSQDNMDYRAIYEYFAGSKEKFIDIMSPNQDKSFMQIIEKIRSCYYPKIKSEDMYESIKGTITDFISDDEITDSPSNPLDKKSRYMKSNKLLLSKYIKRNCQEIAKKLCEGTDINIEDAIEVLLQNDITDTQWLIDPGFTDIAKHNILKCLIKEIKEKNSEKSVITDIYGDLGGNTDHRVGSLEPTIQETIERASERTLKEETIEFGR